MKLSLLKLSLFSLAAAVGLSSCSTVDVAALKKTKKVALISVTTQPYIDPSNAAGSSLVSLVATATQAKELDAKPGVSQMVKALNRNVGKLPVRMVAPKSFVYKKGYKRISDTATKAMGWWSPKPYKAFTAGEPEKIKKAITLAKADAGMLVVYQPKLLKGMKPFTAYLGGAMTIYLIDKQGKTIVKSNLQEKSNTTTTSVMGVWNAKPIQKMMREVVNNNLKKFGEFIAEEMAKAKKKA